MSSHAPRCVTCGHDFKPGDLYIEGASSGFVGENADPAVDGLMADIFGGADGKVMICEDCTEPDPSSPYRFKRVEE